MHSRCPNCGATASLDVLVAHEDARAALQTVFQISQPLGTYVVRYLSLHRPATRELTMARVATLVGQLLPHFKSASIPRKGRDWNVTEEDWCVAIEQMMQARDSGNLSTPLKGHGYLLEVMAGLADKAERMQEQSHDAALRHRGQSAVTVRGVAMPMGQALDAVFGGKDPVLAKLEHERKNATPQPTHVREQLAALRAKTLAQAIVPKPSSPSI